MNDLSIVGAGLAVLGSKELLTKLLGPSADYVGGEVKGFVEKCNINLDRIFVKAAHKLGDKLEVAGTVNSRVLKAVIDEGRFCEDELTSEYYAGLLASGRSSDGKDDISVSLMSVMNCLSSYQVRFHYFIYTIIHDLYEECEYKLEFKSTREEAMKTFIPYEIYDDFMFYGSNIIHFNHCFSALTRHDLVGDRPVAACPHYLNHVFPGYEFKKGGIIVTPSLFGCELYLAAMGITGSYGADFLKARTTKLLEKFNAEGAKPVSDFLIVTPKK